MFRAFRGADGRVVATDRSRACRVRWWSREHRRPRAQSAPPSAASIPKDGRLTQPLSVHPVPTSRRCVHRRFPRPVELSLVLHRAAVLYQSTVLPPRPRIDRRVVSGARATSFRVRRAPRHSGVSRSIAVRRSLPRAFRRLACRTESASATRDVRHPHRTDVLGSSIPPRCCLAELVAQQLTLGVFRCGPEPHEH